MKKIAIILAAALVSVSAFAQKSGEMYVEGSVSLGLVSASNAMTSMGVTTKSTNTALSLNLAPTVGYFVMDNLAVDAILGLSFSSGSTGLDIMPGAKYFINVAENLYYTPGANIGYSFGFNGDHTNALFKFYAYLGSFEYKVSEHFGLVANCLTLAYNNSTEKRDLPGVDQQMTINSSSFALSLAASVGVRYNF